MKIKENLNKVGVMIGIVTENRQIPVTALIEMPYFYAKRYNLWHCFDYTSHERNEVEKMTLKEVFNLGDKELKEPTKEKENAKIKAKPENPISDD